MSHRSIIVMLLVALGAFMTKPASAVYQVGAGRWLQRDPAQYVDGPNLYAYCLGNPVAVTDSTGLDCGKKLQEIINKPAIKHITEQIRRRCGKVTKPIKCCESTDPLCAGDVCARESENVVCICKNAAGDVACGDYDLEMILYHELIHYWQRCDRRESLNQHCRGLIQADHRARNLCLEIGAHGNQHIDPYFGPGACGHLCDRGGNFGYLTHDACIAQCKSLWDCCIDWAPPTYVPPSNLPDLGPRPTRIAGIPDTPAYHGSCASGLCGLRASNQQMND